MRKTTLLVATAGSCAVAALVAASTTDGALQGAYGQDALVLEAVVTSDEWFRPSERGASIVAWARTLPICPESPTQRQCVRSRDLDRLVADEPRRRRFGGSAARATELVESFKARNRESQETPRIAGITFLPWGQLPAEAGPGRYTVFSLPGYSRDGHAMVVVQHLDANSSDNQELLYLLSGGSGGWRVTGRFVIWIA
jgi:hypothetical protein